MLLKLSCVTYAATFVNRVFELIKVKTYRCIRTSDPLFVAIPDSTVRTMTKLIQMLFMFVSFRYNPCFIYNSNRVALSFSHDG